MLGADDYLTKPVPMTVLLAHVRACSLGGRTSLEGGGSRSMVSKPDPVRNCCGIGDVVVNLSGREVEVLACLMLHQDAVVSKDQLLELVWGANFQGDANIVEAYVRHLRMKLEATAGAQDDPRLSEGAVIGSTQWCSQLD